MILKSCNSCVYFQQECNGVGGVCKDYKLAMYLNWMVGVLFCGGLVTLFAIIEAMAKGAR